MNMQTKVKIKFIHFLDPELSYWPYPYTLEQAMGTFQWMIKTGEEYKKSGFPGVIELLSMSPTCINCYRVDPIISTEDLRRRFHFALSGQYVSSSVEKWREDNIINYNSQRILYFPHNKQGNLPQKHFDSFLSTRGKLKTQLNEYHKKAVNIMKIRLFITPTEYIFRLLYGYSYSSWEYDLSRTKNNECFSDTFWRAFNKLNSLMK